VERLEHGAHALGHVVGDVDAGAERTLARAPSATTRASSRPASERTAAASARLVAMSST